MPGSSRGIARTKEVAVKQDRFLMGILIGIAVLVVASVGLFLFRQESQSYLPEDTPEAVVHNYVLALHRHDFDRAYGYLAEKEKRPDLDAFRRSFLSGQLNVDQAAIEVGKAERFDGQAVVQVRVLYVSDVPFSSDVGFPGTATLVLQDGQWRITEMPYPYYPPEWIWAPPD